MRHAAFRACLGLALALAGFCIGASPTRGQVGLAQFATGAAAPSKAVGFGIYYGIGVLNIEAPPRNASNEVKGYTDVLPSSVPGSGFSFGLSYGLWGLIAGVNDNKGPINKFADVNQTPNNPADDVYVKTARRLNTSLTIVYQPVRYVFFGLGHNMGSLEFEQVNPNGTQSTRRIGFENDFFSLGIAFGFNPQTSRQGPILAVFTEHPLAPGNFNGTVDAVAIGWYF